MLKVVMAILLAAGPLLAQAVPVFSEDFESASGATAFPGGAEFNSTEREAGQYFSNVTLPGWTLGNPGQTFVHEGVSGNTSVLLNEDGTTGISRTVGGLFVGVQHNLTFEYGGDNSSLGSRELFEFEIGGVVTPVARISTGLANGNFATATFLFTPTASSTTLRFTETQGGDGVVLDNIRIDTVTAVPEPGMVWLIGVGLLGLLHRSRRTAK